MADIEIELLLDVKDALKSVAKFTEESNAQLKSIKLASLVTSFAALGEIASKVGSSLLSALSEPIKAAEEQQDAINRLNAALQTNNNLTPEVSTNLQEFASQLQRSSRFADEVILSGTALLQTLAPLSEQGLKQATQAAVDLAAGLRIDLNTAFTLVGKAAAGNAEVFARYGVHVQKGKDDAETFANTLTKLNEKFGGRAVADTNSYSGAIAQLKNAFDDVLEEIGGVIVQSPELIAVFRSTAESFVFIAEVIKNNAPVAQAVLRDLILTGQDLVVSLQNGFDSVSKADFFRSNVFQSFKLALVDTGQAVAGVASGIGSVLGNLVGISSDSSRAIGSVNNSFGQLLSSFDESQGFLDKLKQTPKLFNEAGDAANKASGNLFLAGAQFNIEQLIKNLEKLKDDLLKATSTRLELAQRERTERLDLIAEGLKAERLGIEEAARLRSQVEQDFQSKRLAFEKEIAEQQQKAIKDQVDNASAFLNLLKGQARGPGQQGNADKVATEDKLLIAGSQFGSDLLRGAEGAVSVLQAGVGAAATAILGPIGQVVGPILSQIAGTLAQGPEKVREMITGFIQAVPNIILNVIKALNQIPAILISNIGPLLQQFIANLPDLLIQQFIAGFPELLQAITDLLSTLPQTIIDAIPTIVDRFAEKFVTIVDRIIQALPRLIAVIVGQLPFIALQFSLALIAQLPRIAASFVTALVSEAPRFVSELIKAIPSSIGGSISGIGQSAGGIVGSIGDVFGFADGGVIKGGAPFTDRLPAVLTPGETVVDRGLTQRLERFLDGQAGGGARGPQTLVVQLQVGQKELASVLLDLQRAGFRTA